MPAITQLPLDLKGTVLSNRITNETRSIVRVDNSPHRIMIPRFGAFYHDENFSLYDGATRLQPGVDYTTTYLYRDLTKLATKPAYAFIVIINTNVSNTLTLNYHAVGGHFALDVNEIAALMTAINPDNFTVNYEDIIDKPLAYNPAPHMDQYWQLFGAENTITVLNRVRALLTENDKAIVKELQDYASAYHQLALDRLNQERALLNQHLADYNNPHVDTAAKIGLGNLNNWRMTLLSESLQTTLDMYYSTPETGLQAINQSVMLDLNAHIADLNNPHGIRAQDVGAYSATEQNTLLNGRLNKQTPAVNSLKIYGYNLAGWKTYVTTDIVATSITTGLFANAQLGSGAASVNTVLMGNGVWKNWLDLINEKNATVDRSAILYVRTGIAKYSAINAINYLNVNYSDLTLYPVGTKAVFMGYRIAAAFSTWNIPEVKFLIRQAGGWATWLV